MMFRPVGRMLIVGSVALLPGVVSAAPPKVMSGQEIQAGIVGNTISGVEDNERYIEYFEPDGRILGRGDSGAYFGTWRIEGDKLCVNYDKKNAWDCSALRLQGSKLIWVDPYGDLITTLSKGDTEFVKAGELRQTAKAPAETAVAETETRSTPVKEPAAAPVKEPASTPVEAASTPGVKEFKDAAPATSTPVTGEESKSPATGPVVAAGERHAEAAAAPTTAATEAATRVQVETPATATVTPPRVEPATTATVAAAETRAPDASVRVVEEKHQLRLAPGPIRRHAHLHRGVKPVLGGHKPHADRVARHRHHGSHRHFSDRHGSTIDREPLVSPDDGGRVRHELVRTRHAHWRS